MFNFENTYKKLQEDLYTSINPEIVKSPKIIILNKQLLDELGIDNNNLKEYLSGNLIPEGSEPIAQAYAGHQFGHLTILGDGRAVLLGEHTTPKNIKYDIQLKGSGQTPYSRSGDGRATLYSMLREYLISYSMDKLNVPTTRSLAVVETGEDVFRSKIEKGGILTRVAISHIRVGTFQFVAMQGDLNQLKVFTDYVINRLYPELEKSANPYLDFLETVMNKQIDLIINWLRVGFIHGVMNTDNMSISAETIDYGPCAFMDSYHPKTVFSSIDQLGRYSFENQKNIGGWNISRFAETLIPLIDNSEEVSLKLINEVLSKYKTFFNKKYIKMMGAKIGIENPVEEDIELINELLNIMENNNLDYTKTFRNLLKKEELLLTNWYKKWELKEININLMNKNNPVVIPRNHIVEEVLLEASEKNNLIPLEELIKVMSKPYNENIKDFYKNPPEIVDEEYKTFCGT